MNPARSVCLLLLLFPLILLGNVGVFDGGGADLQLSGTDHIQMVSEQVEITLVPADGPVTGNLKHRDLARFQCRFVLKNLSDVAVTAQVGFPITAEDGRADTEGDARFQTERMERYGFVARSGDDVYEPEYIPKDKEKQFSHLFAWEMTFPPSSTKVLEVSYLTHGYNGLGSTRKRPIDWELQYKKPYLESLEFGIAQVYPYVTRTAESWAPPLENAEFILNNAAFEQYLKERGAFDETEPDKALSEPQKTQSDLFRDGQFYRAITAGDWKPSSDGQSLVWRESPFTEPEDFAISYIFTMYPKSPQGFERLLGIIETEYEKTRSQYQKSLSDLKSEDDPKQEKRRAYLQRKLEQYYAKPFGNEDRKNIADAVLEFYGIQTDNAALAEFLAHQSWYPVKNPPVLSPDLESALMAWHRIE
ncbi:hypothetical protein [Ruficoccus sp. ZRK36]|uniref:hypothetical protein n=1 Tax=Ruficoccus sp. ZRK36 TaxID=2866311 RepID=UPI001C72A7B5|nr:hypothetical protein [Ruficoccus sp. ZRK36]QYY37320.1 hypothetical protein K0V07_07495 [Ruficoccus sp. ZRK36]